MDGVTCYIAQGSCEMFSVFDDLLIYLFVLSFLLLHVSQHACVYILLAITSLPSVVLFYIIYFIFPMKEKN